MKNASLAVLLVGGIALSYALGYHHGPLECNFLGERRAPSCIDPTHPASKSDKAGTAPDGGMRQEVVYANEEGQTAVANSPVSGPAGTFHLDLRRQQQIGLRLATVERSEGARNLHLTGRVAVEDTRVYRVTAAVQGWIRETYEGASGTAVKKDQRLAVFYSPEFLPFVNGYLTAADRGGVQTKESLRAVQYAADRLRAMGMSEAQIKEIGETRKLPGWIDVVSPTDGFVLARNIAQGMRFEEQAEFYRIADLSHIWIIADVFADDAHSFRPGTVVRVTLPGRQKVFHARVSNVLSQVDPITRIVKLRMEADNPTFALRPDMFVDVELPVQTSSALTVPADAVLDSGLKKRVFVDRGNGFFESREVETGWCFGGRVQIIRGLSEGENVVASGAFLVDSESPLRSEGGDVARQAHPRPNRGIKSGTAARKPIERLLTSNHSG